MAALDIVLHENEGGLVELLLGVFRQQGAVLPAQTLNVDDHQAAVLLGQLEQLQRLGDLQPQIKIIIDQLQQAALLGLGGYDDAVAGKQALEIIGRDLLTGDGALADAGKHGVGQVQADVYFFAGFGIAHGVPPINVPMIPAPPGGASLSMDRVPQAPADCNKNLYQERLFVG